MLDALTDKFTGVFRALSGRGRISEENIRESMREVRTALLEADVNFKVVKDFTEAVVQKALGQEVIKTLRPGEPLSLHPRPGPGDLPHGVHVQRRRLPRSKSQPAGPAALAAAVPAVAAPGTVSTGCGQGFAQGRGPDQRPTAAAGPAASPNCAPCHNSHRKHI